MLNYETLLSSYDDKLTLMQWLKKVEAALKDASAVSFNVNKRGDATLTFSVVFEDGSELESNPITLQQGESVASAYITNGHLHLVLTNGDDLDAGSMFNGDITLSGTLTISGIHATSTGVKTSVIQQNNENGIDVFASVVSLNNGLEAQGDIESETTLKAPLLEVSSIKLDGRPLILEEDPTTYAISGITYTYSKMSLCGSHLMYVVAGTIESNTTIPDNTPICSVALPRWLADKIIPYSSNQWVDNKMLEVHTNSYSIVNAGLMALQKVEQVGSLPYLLRIYSNSGSHAVATGGSFRLQFDLIIDME